MLKETAHFAYIDIALVESKFVAYVVVIQEVWGCGAHCPMVEVVVADVATVIEQPQPAPP